MKTLIVAACIIGALSTQGCVAYAEPSGGYYVRDNVWYYKDVHGREWHENHRYHHAPADEHHDMR